MKVASRRLGMLMILSAIILLALGLRLYRLDAQSLWNDEGSSVALAQRDLPTITRNAAGDIHPPLYYYLLHFWVSLAGHSEFALRSFSALAGVALVGGTYLLGRRLFGLPTAIIAALISALSPFQVYYSQEARMYIFVSLFGLLSMITYERLLNGRVFTSETLATGREKGAPPAWRQMSAPDRFNRGPASCWRSLFNVDVESDNVNGRIRWDLGLNIGAYILAGLLTIYSQYFGFTLLLAQNIGFLGWLVWPRRMARRDVWKVILYWAGVQTTLLLCYVPWLLASWDSLRSWPAIAAPLSFSRLALDIIRVFSLGQTAGGGRAATAASMALFLLVVAGMLCPTKGSRSADAADERGARASFWNIALSALYLLVPIAVMYGLTLRRPMYKPKFLLLATPAYYILLARGLIACGHWAERVSRSRWARMGLTLLLTAAVCAASAYSLYHLYYDARYYRDDYRGIVAYINATAGSEDAILINAPSQIETVDYYYHGLLAQYPLPLERPMDTARTEAALQGIVERHPRVYAILWATGDSDPGRFIEGWLDQRCFKALDSWFGNVRLAVYAVPQSPAQEIEHPLDYMLGETVRLKGYTLLTPQPRSGDIVQLALFWEAVRPVKERYKVFTHVVDSRGNIVGQRDSEPAGGSRLTSDWSPGEVIVDNYGLPLPPGTPSGEHILRIGMYALDDGRRLPVSKAGQSAGDAIDLMRLTIRPVQAPPPIAALNVQHQDNARWGELELVGHSLNRLGFEHQPELPLRPGDVGKLTLFWRKASGPPAQERFIVALSDRAGRGVWEQRLQIAGGTFPLSTWREGEVVRDIQQLPLPPGLTPGTYRLTLRPDGWEQKTYTLAKLTISR